MHGNEPILIAMLAWLGFVAFCGFQSLPYITRPGPGRGFRVIYFALAMIWLWFWGGALAACVVFFAMGQYPVPSVAQLVDRFDDNTVDACLGLFGLVIPALALPVIWLAELARRQKQTVR